MQTDFTPEALRDPGTQEAEAVLRKCVHCGFCLATCPTYTLLRDELDSPRGRIYLMKNMLEEQAVPTRKVVRHVDRCLSCLSCMTTCPSGVNYMRLVDHARFYIEKHYRRPLSEKFVRWLIAATLPHPGRFRLVVSSARLVRFMQPVLRKFSMTKPLAAMLEATPQAVHPIAPRKSATAASAEQNRVLLLTGCVEPVLRPEFQAAAIRLIERMGFAVERAGERCCGALTHHLGREKDALAAARQTIDAWSEKLDANCCAIVMTTSGCGTTIKDYGHLLRNDPVYAKRAERVSALAMDVSEFVSSYGLPETKPRGLVVAYHPACSLQHGQGITDLPARLLAEAGYQVVKPRNAHLCCGSAGSYNLLQPDIAGELGDQKARALEDLQSDIVATGNIGCAMQIGRRLPIPIVHTVELLDWASGGPVPAAISTLRSPHSVPDAKSLTKLSG